MFQLKNADYMRYSQCTVSGMPNLGGRKYFFSKFGQNMDYFDIFVNLQVKGIEQHYFLK